MSHTFKPGDLVRCIDDDRCSFIEQGNLYQVESISNVVDTILLKGYDSLYDASRFELVQPAPIDYSNTTTLEEPPMEPPATPDSIKDITAAVLGLKGPGQRAIAKAGIELTTLLLKKNTDYGNSAMTPPILAPSMSAREAIQCRMSDKIRRLERLLAGNTAEVNESIEDTISDLGGYSILWLACED